MSCSSSAQRSTARSAAPKRSLVRHSASSRTCSSGTPAAAAIARWCAHSYSEPASWPIRRIISSRSARGVRAS